MMKVEVDLVKVQVDFARYFLFSNLKTETTDILKNHITFYCWLSDLLNTEKFHSSCDANRDICF